VPLNVGIVRVLGSWRFLGIVTPRRSDCVNAHVRPLFRWDGKWIAISSWADKFLPQWRDAPSGAYAGSLWAFSLDREDTDEVSAESPLPTEETSDNKREREPFEEGTELFLRVDGDEPVFAYEVIKQESDPSLAFNRSKNEPSLLDEIEAVRTRYVIDGTDAAPLGPVLADIKEKCVVGPLTLSRHEDGRWRAMPQIVSVRAPFPPQSFHTLDMEGGKRKIRLASEELPIIVSEADFRSDDAVLEDAISEAASSENDGETEARLLARDSLASLLSFLAERRRTQASQPAEEYRIKRLEFALRRVDIERTRSERWRDAVLETPEAHAIMEQARREAVKSALKELDETLKETQEHLDAQRRALDSLNVDITSRQERLKELDASIQSAHGKLTEATDARIMAIAAKLSDEMTEHIAAQFVSLGERNAASETNAERSRTRLTLTPAPILTQWKSAVARDDIPTLTEACERLRRKFASAASSSRLAELLLAAWISDLIPVIVSPDSLSIVRCAASCLTAKRLVVVPTANATTLPDLFGRIDCAASRYVPSPAGLADILLAMTHGEFEDKLGIAAFADVNLTETAAVFRPLAEAYRVAWEEPSDAWFPLLHPIAVEETDPYLPLARAAWPPTLLPAFTWADGASPLPPPPAFWQMTALIVAHLTEEQPRSKQVYEIRAAAWEQGRQEVHRRKPLSASRSLASGDRRLMGALLSLGVPEEEACRLTFLTRRLPALLSEGREPSEAEMPPETPQDAVDAVRHALLYGS
jgi:hypothetical protein